MSKRLHVGNLSYQTTTRDLATLFGQFGEVLDATVITDRESGRSRGSGSWRWTRWPRRRR